MASKIDLVVIFGGRSGEHAVSLRSARSVLSVIDTTRYNIHQVGITSSGRWVTGANVLEALEQNDISHLPGAAILGDPSRPGLFQVTSSPDGEKLTWITKMDVVFPVLHGTYGEDGTLQGLLEMADVAYVGAGVLGSSAAMDKALFKDVLRANGIPMVPYILATRVEVENDLPAIIKAAEKLSRYPLFVKPANMGSSVGVSKCRNRSDLQEGLIDAARYDRRILIEMGVNAREIEVSVLGNDRPQASVPGEINPNADFYSYAAKYLDDKSDLLIPAAISSDQTARIQQLAIKAYQAADCAGMARADFFLDNDTGEIYLNEINTIPGFTSISMYPKLWEASGLTYPRLVDRLIELGMDRKAERDRTVRTYGRGS